MIHIAPSMPERIGLARLMEHPRRQRLGPDVLLRTDDVVQRARRLQRSRPPATGSRDAPSPHGASAWTAIPDVLVDVRCRAAHPQRRRPSPAGAARSGTRDSPPARTARASACGAKASAPDAPSKPVNTTASLRSTSETSCITHRFQHHESDQRAPALRHHAQHALAALQPPGAQEFLQHHPDGGRADIAHPRQVGEPFPAAGSSRRSSPAATRSPRAATARSNGTTASPRCPARSASRPLSRDRRRPRRGSRA